VVGAAVAAGAAVVGAAVAAAATVVADDFESSPHAAIPTRIAGTNRMLRRCRFERGCCVWSVKMASL
jgi:hypothetical protein